MINNITSQTHGSQPITQLATFKGSGLTKREFFASQILAGIACNAQPHIRGNDVFFADWSVRYADALIARLSSAKK